MTDKSKTLDNLDLIEVLQVSNSKFEFKQNELGYAFPCNICEHVDVVFGEPCQNCDHQ